MDKALNSEWINGSDLADAEVCRIDWAKMHKCVMTGRSARIDEIMFGRGDEHKTLIEKGWIVLYPDRKKDSGTPHPKATIVTYAGPELDDFDRIVHSATIDLTDYAVHNGQPMTFAERDMVRVMCRYYDPSLRDDPDIEQKVKDSTVKIGSVKMAIEDVSPEEGRRHEAARNQAG